jgi:predicted nucleotidyltransferase
MARAEQESTLRRPLTAVLGVDSNLRVLRTLAGHGGQLSSSEIVRLSGLSRESVRLALISLEAMAMVETTGSSHSKVYRFNDRNVLAPAMMALFEAEGTRFEAILGCLRRIGAGLPILSLFIYGSVARGSDRPGSDLDIGLVAKTDDLPTTIEAMREGLRDPSERLGFRPNVVGLDLSDLHRLEAGTDEWWQAAKQDAIVLVGRRPEELIPLRETVSG